MTLLLQNKNAVIYGASGGIGEGRMFPSRMVNEINQKGRRNMDWKLEVVPIPVTDVDRAKAFYAEQVGFVVAGLAPGIDAHGVRYRCGSG
jgi:hypothetical protein